MSLINNVSMKLSGTLKGKYGDAVPSIEIMRYSIKFLITNLTPILLILLIGFTTNNIINTLIAMIGFISLRLLSGGYHIASAELCIIFSTVLVVGISNMSFLKDQWYLFQIASLILVALFAPFNIKKVPELKRKTMINLNMRR